MTVTLKETAKALREHADAVFRMPVGEQFIGGRDVAFHSAMKQIADALEELDRRTLGRSLSRKTRKIGRGL
jgi:hypothetical protein